jgi:hypothetical protein
MAFVQTTYTDGVVVTGLDNQSSNSFVLAGGLYGATVVGTFSSTNAGLNKLGPDGATWVAAITPFTANGFATVYLPPGTYQAVGTATSFDIAVQRIKLS